MPSVDAITYRRRISQIQGWILEGSPTSLIVQQIIASGWSNAKNQENQERTAMNMIRAAREQWITSEEGTLEERRQIKIAELQLLKRSLNARFKGTPAGIRAIIAVEKEIIRLDGLDPAKKIEISTPEGKPLEVRTTTSINPDNMKAIAEILKTV